jgi:hypothetical protein
MYEMNLFESAYEPFVEDGLPGDLDMALFEFGEQHAGQGFDSV